MILVKILVGEYEGLHGLLQGYVGDKGKVLIPIEGEEDITKMIKIGGFEII